MIWGWILHPVTGTSHRAFSPPLLAEVTEPKYRTRSQRLRILPLRPSSICIIHKTRHIAKVPHQPSRFCEIRAETTAFTKLGGGGVLAHSRKERMFHHYNASLRRSRLARRASNTSTTKHIYNSFKLSWLEMVCLLFGDGDLNAH